MSKNKAATAHGEVEYETVNCCNCGTEIMADDAVAASVGIGIKHRSFSGMSVRGGHGRNLCEYCADSIFGRSDGRGAVKTGFNLVIWRVVQLDDMGFAAIMALLFGAIGTVVGLGLIGLVAELLAVVL